jgi:gas vesicle protein
VRPGRWVGLAVVTTALLATFAAPSAAAPDEQATLSQLTKQAAGLEKAYRGEIASLDDARDAAGKSSTRAKNLQSDLRTAERQVVEFAQMSYMGGGIDDSQLFSMRIDPGTYSTMEYLSDLRAEQLNNVKSLIEQHKEATQDAGAKIRKLQKRIKELQAKQRDVERRIAKFGIQKPGSASGLTSRLINVRAAIMASFPMPFGVGCLRVGDPGEHGKGRACDFMMSSGGRMPDAVAKERGDAVAQWCIDNAGKYGIMYIIWRQRIYDMRTGGGWQAMEDRGGITANHYDHVHVSVL